MDDAVVKIIGLLKEEMENTARDNVQHPESKKFKHGIQVGTYQGLQKALEIVTVAIGEPEDEN